MRFPQEGVSGCPGLQKADDFPLEFLGDQDSTMNKPQAKLELPPQP